MRKLFYIIGFAGILASCNMPANTATNDKGAKNEARVQQFYDEVFNAHNPAMIDSFCHADFVDHQPSPGHSGKGSADLKAQFTEFFAAYPDIHAKTDFMISRGDTVVAKITMTGTNTGAMGPNQPATNKSFNIELADIIIVKDGKAIERWGYAEEMKMMTQLGMMGGGPPEAPKEGDKKAEKK